MCCLEGGTLQTNITSMCGVLSMSGPHWFAPLMVCVLSRFTLLRLQVAMLGNCLRRALGCVHFPDLYCSGSGSWLLCKGTDSVGPVFCALARSGQLRRPGAWHAHSSQLGDASYHLAGPSCSVSWVHSGSAISDTLCDYSWV